MFAYVRVSKVTELITKIASATAEQLSSRSAMLKDQIEAFRLRS